jgi:hypothetical protein
MRIGSGLQGLQMRVLRKSVFVVSVALASTAVRATDDVKTATFAVIRNDTRIGTSTISIADDGPGTKIASATHVAVKLAFLTLYHFDQTETEEWAGGRWQSLSATTDDNGKVHHVVASNAYDGITVQGNGQMKRIAASVMPASLWNDAILTRNAALDPLDGTIVPVKISDRGQEDLIVQGKPTRVRHYTITTSFSQDVWYDGNHQLVQVEMKGSDGSLIRYLRV